MDRVALKHARQTCAADNAVPARINRCAVFVPPHVGGIFTFYRSLRAALGERVFSVELEGEQALWRDYAPHLSGREHRILPLQGRTGTSASRAVVDWLQAEDVDAVLLFPLTPSAVYDALPHLPAHVRALVRLTEASPHTYDLALRRATSLDGIIVQCPRQIADTAARAPGVRRYLIPNGVDVARFEPREVNLRDGDPIPLLVLDRLVHLQKRILFLPRLCTELDARNQPFRLTVVGDGPDAEALRRELAPWLSKGIVNMIGFLQHDQVPDVLAAHAIYLKLSRNEGSPNSVLEAAASGVPSIAVRIPGVTDYVIEDGVSGRLVPADDMRAMAEAVVYLAGDPAGRARWGAAARQRAVAEFSLENIRERYTSLFDTMPRSSRQQSSWSDWSDSAPKRSALWSTLRGVIPLEARVRVREALETVRKRLLVRG